MASNECDDNNVECKIDIHDQLTPTTTPTAPLLQRVLSDSRTRRHRLLDILQAHPFSSCHDAIDDRDEKSKSVPSPAGLFRRLHVPFVRTINWSSLRKTCVDWLKHPMHVALLLWVLCVAASGAMLFLVMLGFLDNVYPKKFQRRHWIEINDQILNALFTLMSIYQHPKLFHHLFLLIRWTPDDIVELRKVYCKNGAYRPNEWTHIVVVVSLLHLTCFAQYALCALYWAYTSTTRPEFWENFCVVFGLGTPVVAGVYSVYSPLGRDYDVDSDSDGDSLKTGLKLYERRRQAAVAQPEWAGGVFDCGDDTTVAYLSFFCTCCVFGWNMERLGFGNMYVHIVTFVLLCFAPFWIFNVAALNIHDDVIRDTVGVMGVVLCAFGLIYGGFWRIQMRKRFKLPSNGFCCGVPSLTDYAQWMFCWACSLAQEVRTGNFYDVEEDGLYRKLDIDEDVEPGTASPTIVLDSCSTPKGGDGAMSPPTPALIQIEEHQLTQS
ncbi:hypothetical protein QJS04_geneDACA005917 [Acorus gramineus]|uniref:Uncharacterized protein n=1 Tax=Acorus gramineus TaxID=55184 RepID=A0AAV9B7P2_ACOGR|nr:hypothetical protein QJS04_geneDACA005917 [Acorus gramineus]